MVSILFDGNSFDNFPVSIFNGTDIYLSNKFKNGSNKNFLKTILVKGINIIYIKSEYIFPYDLVIRDSGKELENSEKSFEIDPEKDQENSGEDFFGIPVLFYNDSEIFNIIKTCNCGTKSETIHKEKLDNIYILSEIETLMACEGKCLMNVSRPSQLSLSSLQEDTLNSFKKGSGSNLGIGSTRDEKFQDSMRKEAMRLEHAERREKYKKHMRHISTRKSSLSSFGSSLGSSGVSNTKVCKAKTKKGTRCTNKVVGTSDYCGIISHKDLSSLPITNKGIIKGTIKEQFITSSLEIS